MSQVRQAWAWIESVHTAAWLLSVLGAAGLASLLPETLAGRIILGVSVAINFAMLARAAGWRRRQPYDHADHLRDHPLPREGDEHDPYA